MAQFRVPGAEVAVAKDFSDSRGGFNFDLCARNEAICAAAGGRTAPQPMSTGAQTLPPPPRPRPVAHVCLNPPPRVGTTICGVVYEGGVVLGADTRAAGADATNARPRTSPTPPV